LPKRLKVGEQEFLVEEFKTLTDDWNEYETASGVKVRARLIVNKIARQLDKAGRPVFDEHGEPRMLIQSQNIVVATDGLSSDASDKEVH
jgi:hypothetical protein